jgi:hypothetical protein
MTLLKPPRVELSWTATALGAAFNGYNIYRRPARGVAWSWEKIGTVSIPVGYSPTTVESQHTKFTDYEAGWTVAGGQWADGWDYAVTVVNLTTGVESALSTIDTQNQVTPDITPWVVCNAAPYLNFPIGVAEHLDASRESTVKKFRAAGRDQYVTRSGLELPGRLYRIGAHYYDRVGEDPLRLWHAASASGRAVALMMQRGDRCIGVLDAPSATSHLQVGDLTHDGVLVESSKTSMTADHNQPCGLVLNGTTQAITHPNNALINPGAGPFSIVVAAAFANSAANRAAFGKGSIGGGDGYWIRSTGTPNEMGFTLDGATAGPLTITEANAAWYDGNVRVAIGTHNGATAQVLYRDGVQVATGANNVGTITNAVAMAAGANNGGTVDFMACAPIVGWAYYPRVLTPAEALATSNYFLGYPGYRPAANPNLLIDCRDNRTWNGVSSTLVDIAAIPPNLNGTVVAAPATRGIPWPFASLDKF